MRKRRESRNICPKFLVQGEQDYTKNKYLTYEENMGGNLPDESLISGAAEARAAAVQKAQTRRSRGSPSSARNWRTTSASSWRSTISMP